MIFPLLQLLAQTPYEKRLKGLRGAFHNRKSDPADLHLAVSLFVALAALIALILVIRGIRRRQAGKAVPKHPFKLYNHVLSQLGVSLQDRFLMRLLARNSLLPQPTILFFSEDIFDLHVKRWLETMRIKSFQKYARSRVEIVAELAFPGNTTSESAA